MVLQQHIISGFIGTYTKNNSRGIYRFNLNTVTGKIERLFLTYEIENPTYLCFDKDNHIIYSSCKIDNNCGVASFKYYKEQDFLNLVNYNTSEKEQPCHVSIDMNKSILISSNYHENKMIVYKTLSGIILNYPKTANHHGHGINMDRQSEPHIHCSLTTHNSKFILSADLGIDQVIVYEFNGNDLLKRKDLSLTFPGGSGPRHITYADYKPFYYILSELSSEIFVYKYIEKSNSILTHIQTIDSNSRNYTGIKLGAAIKIHPNNRFLFTSDRGNNSINLFSINSSDGKLSYSNSFDCHGNCPRDFSISNDGKFLICANLESNNISIFSINEFNGTLTHIQTTAVPCPSCILFT